MRHKKYTAVCIIITVLCFSFLSSFAQEWEWQNPLPIGGDERCIEFIDSLHGWFGFGGGIVLHTTDGGNNWEIQKTGISNLWVSDINFINKDEGWLAGQVDRGHTAYILHTKNGGNTWEIQWLEKHAHSINIVLFLDSQRGLYGTKDWGEIYLTTDGGYNWQLVHDSWGEVLSFAFIDSLTGFSTFGGLQGYLLRTEDGGQSWSADSAVTGCHYVFFKDSAQGWIGKYDGRLWKTTDGGASWSDDIIVHENHRMKEVFFTDSLHGWASSYEGYSFRTTNGGQTWDILGSLRPVGIRFFDSSNGWMGLYKTSDGGVTRDYQIKDIFGSDTHLWDMHFISKGIGMVAGHHGRIGSTRNAGETWIAYDVGMDVDLKSIHMVDSIEVWIVGDDDLLMRSSDGGQTWQEQAFTYASGYEKTWFTDSNNGWLIGGDETEGWIYKTGDGGDSWTMQIADGSSAFQDICFVSPMEGWGITKNGDIYHTSDGGDVWALQYTNNEDDLSTIQFLDQNTGWAYNYNNVTLLGTTDGGNSWAEIGQVALEDVHFISKESGWGCSLSGYLYSTTDGGVTWLPETSNTSHGLNEIYFADDSTGWCIGDNSTILKYRRTTNTGISGENFAQAVIDHFHLGNCYPNPFNSSTVINYHLEKKGNVRISIIDILGREVKILVDSYRSAGSNEVIWNGEDNHHRIVPSSIYLVRACFEGKKQQIQKIVLTK